MEKFYILQDAKVRQDSVFDMGDLYKMLFRWFETNDYNFYEKEYSDAEDQRGKMVQFFWTANKDVDDYVQFGFDVSCTVTGLKPVEVEKGGLKIKSHAANVDFRVSAYMVKDPKGQWSTTGGMKLMRKIYERILARRRYDQLLVALDREARSLVDEMRAFLSLHVF